jgi:AcrR family transcriptional regulator
MSRSSQQPHADAVPRDEGRVGVSDQRVLRGLRSRRTILDRAVHMASLEGLNGLSLGRLAGELQLSKSGVQALFGTKENLQIAAAEYARRAFYEAVIAPALAAPPGTARLRALIEHWIVYAERPLFEGGCFWAANLADFDSRPGPVRDVLVHHQQDWRDLIAAELRHAIDAGEIADLDVDLAAFQIDAVLIAANTAFRLGDPEAALTVRHVIERLLVPAA